MEGIGVKHKSQNKIRQPIIIRFIIFENIEWKTIWEKSFFRIVFSVMFE